MGLSLTDKSNMVSNFSETLHFRDSAVIPNHIFIAFNYQIYKFLVLNFYLICFFHEIIIFRCFSNEMKMVTENNNGIVTTIDLPTYKCWIRPKHALTRTYMKVITKKM